MKPISLNELFKQKIFRIPDYQRGYAWQQKQCEDFWDDIINLNDNRSHYTGVLSLKEIPTNKISDTDNEYWLVEDHSYKVYDIVDGQQRITTCIIFIQSLIEVIRELDENIGKKDNEIYITESLNLNSIINSFLYKLKPNGGNYRTYKFGYHTDNPSYQYMRYNILGEKNPGTINETFYTLNLKNAKLFFKNKIKLYYKEKGIKGLQSLYKKISKRFLFNEYIIEDEFDVFVAFETMNNRGKSLSKLELLKNRLIYLTTLYPETELDAAGRKNLRDKINDAWKEVYYQLGRNDKKPLNDDDFLKAHWSVMFKYSRKKGDDYINFLLNEYFTPKNIFNKTNQNIDLDSPENIHTSSDINNNNFVEDIEELEDIPTAALSPASIEDYVLSLKSSAIHWFHTHYPHLSQSSDLQPEVRNAIDRLNRLGMGYFRSLVMSLLKNEKSLNNRLLVLNRIEKFIFISFRLCRSFSNYGDSEFYNAARELDKGLININDIIEKLNDRESFCYHKNGDFNSKFFEDYMYKRFTTGAKLGYYGWNGLTYFLYEYELEKMKLSGQKKVDWTLFIKNDNDKISIEHIFPQTPNDEYWEKQFQGINDSMYPNYNGSIGNLLLLSSSINSSLQNDSYTNKKKPKYNKDGVLIRKGYYDGSHSEIEVTQKYQDWGPKEIYSRGLQLLNFLEERWKINITDSDKEKLLFLNYIDDSSGASN